MKENIASKTSVRAAREPGAGISRFITAFTLLSRIPVKRRFEADFSRSDFWLPAISPLVSISSIAGFAAGIVLTGQLWLAITASIALQYFLFNLFHFDGLLDSADALLPAASKERRLEILKDPRIGSYGFFCGLLALGLRSGAMVLLAENGLYFFALAGGLLAAPLAGRTAAAIVVLRLKPARPDGLGALMQGFTAGRVVLGAALGFIPAAALCLVAGNWSLLIACLAAAAAGGLLAAVSVGGAYRRALGGLTGDALGAAIEWGEIAALLALGIFLRLFGISVI